jgi:hypothetical protein
MKKILLMAPALLLFFSCRKNAETTTPETNTPETKVAESKLNFRLSEEAIKAKNRQFIDEIIAKNGLGTNGDAETQPLTANSTICPMSRVSQYAFLTARDYISGECPNRTYQLTFRWMLSRSYRIKGTIGGGIFAGSTIMNDFSFVIQGVPASATYLYSIPIGGNVGTTYTEIDYFDVRYTVDELTYSSLPAYFTGTAVYNGSCAITLDPASLQLSKTLNYCQSMPAGGISRTSINSMSAFVFTECSLTCLPPYAICPSSGTLKYRPLNDPNAPIIQVSVPPLGLILSGLTPGVTYQYWHKTHYGNPLNCSSEEKYGTF